MLLLLLPGSILVMNTVIIQAHLQPEHWAVYEYSSHTLTVERRGVISGSVVLDRFPAVFTAPPASGGENIYISSPPLSLVCYYLYLSHWVHDLRISEPALLAEALSAVCVL